MKMDVDDVVLLLGVLVVIAIMVIGVTMKVDYDSKGVPTIEAGHLANGLRYEYAVIDGMPCLTVSEGHQAALTCDWSKWKGTDLRGTETN